MSNEQLDCSHVCTSYISSLNHSWSFRFQIHQLTAGNISRSPVLRNSWVNMSPKNGTWKTVGQLDCLCWVQEQRRSQSSQRMQRLWPLGRMKGIGTCTRGRKDDEKWIILQTYHRYNMIICVLHYVCCFRSPTATLHSFECYVWCFSHNRLGPRFWTVCRSISSLDLWRSEKTVDGVWPPRGEDMKKSIWNGSFWYYCRCDKCDDSNDSDILTRIMHIINCSFQWTFCPA